MDVKNDDGAPNLAQDSVLPPGAQARAAPRDLRSRPSRLSGCPSPTKSPILLGTNATQWGRARPHQAVSHTQRKTSWQKRDPEQAGKAVGAGRPQHGLSRPHSEGGAEKRKGAA